MSDKKIDKLKVRALHASVDAALSELARLHGLVYVPGGMTYTDETVTGRMKFALPGHEGELRRKQRPGLGVVLAGFKVKDLVRIKGESGVGPRKQYEVTGFGRTSVYMKRLPDGKEFRCNPAYLEKIGENAGTVTPPFTTRKPEAP